MGNFIDLTGQRFGRLVVMRRAENRKQKTMWLCQCDCGNTSVVDSDILRRGKTRSCGCLLSESTKNRMKKYDRPTHRLCCLLCAIIKRCYDETDPRYPSYGGRGITVCDEWLQSKSSFYDWAYKNGYDPNAAHGECTIDRIDNDGPYAPWNCRWVPMRDQCRNTRRNIWFTVNGETKVLEDWAKGLGISSSAIQARIKRGWSIEEALTTPRYEKGGKYKYAKRSNAL